MQYSRVYLLPNPFIFLSFNAGPRICLGQQFAYNEMSFFMVRLLQTFSNITLDPSAQDPETHVPKAWAEFPGRKGKEKVWPKSHITLYMHVSNDLHLRLFAYSISMISRVVCGLKWRRLNPPSPSEGCMKHFLIDHKVYVNVNVHHI